MAPEIGAESSQDVFVGFEADTFHHQHAVTEKPLNPLLLELLEEVGAVAGQGVHGQPAAETTPWKQNTRAIRQEQLLAKQGFY